MHCRRFHRFAIESAHLLGPGNEILPGFGQQSFGGDCMASSRMFRLPRSV